MKHFYVESVKIGLHLDADGWDLYDLPGREAAAADLSHTFEWTANSGESLNAVYRAMLAKMREYANLGAMDSEPMYQLDKLIEQLRNAREGWPSKTA